MIYDPNYDPQEDHGSASEQVDRLRKNARLKSVNQDLRSLQEDTTDNLSAKQERFNHLIRDGVSLEIQNAILEARRELDQHQKLGRLTKVSQQLVDEFRKMADSLLERKRLLEKLNDGIASLKTKLEADSIPSLELKLKHAEESAQKIIEECSVLSERIIVFRGRIEQQVHKDQAQEQDIKNTLERCLNHLAKQEKGKLMVSIKQKTETLPFEQRIVFYSQLIQQFAQKIPAIRDEEIVRLFERTQKSFHQKNYKEALGFLDQLFKFDKQHLPGHRLRADIYQEMGNKVAFMCELRMIIKIDLVEGRDFYRLAEVLYESGQIEEAFAHYEDAILKDPNCKYLEKLGDVCNELRRWYRAVQVYQQILKQSPKLGRVMHKLGRALLENNREEEAFAVLRQAIQIKDNNSNSRVCVGRIYRRRSAFQDALESFQRAVELDQNNVESFYWWSAMLFDRGEFLEALSHAQKAVELDSERVRNRLICSKALGALGRYKEALDVLEPCLSAATPSVDVLLTYSEMCRNSNLEDKGIDVLGVFLKRFPRQPQIRAEYGVLLVQAGRLKDAKEFLQPPGHVPSA